MKRVVPILLVALGLPGCVGPGNVKDAVHYKFEAKEGAELVVDAPGGFRIMAKGPVTIETSGAGLYESYEPEAETVE